MIDYAFLYMFSNLNVIGYLHLHMKKVTSEVECFQPCSLESRLIHHSSHDLSLLSFYSSFPENGIYPYSSFFLQDDEIRKIIDETQRIHKQYVHLCDASISYDYFDTACTQILEMLAKANASSQWAPMAWVSDFGSGKSLSQT